MKNIFFLILISFVLYSCKCEKTEVERYLLKNENKEYTNVNMRAIKYIDQDNNLIYSNFDGAKSILNEDRVGPEVCSYRTNEIVTENFIIGPYIGQALFLNEILGVSLYNDTERYNLNIQSFQANQYDNALQDITLQGYTFNNVLVLENSNEDDIYSTIIYSKTNGIEFILFEDGSWYKRLDE
jgi:hypothetical protein